MKSAHVACFEKWNGISIKGVGHAVHHIFKNHNGDTLPLFVVTKFSGFGDLFLALKKGST